ncbi:MAG: SMC-Scp complex subunit ScpB [Clostridiaceae bacterium]|jgi:segregation and condensation protein B|nr:SMC-Scp complex subunit ScpB [Clostridiaceae bacterium]
MTEDQGRLRQQTAAELMPENMEAGGDDFQLPLEDAAAAIEALLFVSGDPLPLDRLAQVTGLEGTVLKGILNTLAWRLEHDRQRGLLLREVEGSFFLATKPELKTVLQRLFQPRQRPPLSQAAYETLAIIAYNQPVTRAQVESVRGVNSDSIMARLVERSLIQETGHLDTPGRPILYTTTEQFLQDFGLRSVKELPPMEMLMYGTLRDLESSLEEASGTSDRQMTIDQLVQAYVPGDEAEKTQKTPDDDLVKGYLPAKTVIAVSEAIFGEEDGGEPPTGRSSPD